MSIGTLYILDDGEDVALVRMQGESLTSGWSRNSRAMAQSDAARSTADAGSHEPSIIVA